MNFKLEYLEFWRHFRVDVLTIVSFLAIGTVFYVSLRWGPQLRHLVKRDKVDDAPRNHQSQPHKKEGV